MQPILNKLVPVPDCSFSLQINECKQLVYPLHFHEEYQLNYIKNGKGKVMIGAQMHDYGPGDLFLIGPDLPHFWTYDDKFFEEAGAGKTFVIHFSDSFAGEGFLERPEMMPVKILLARSCGGVAFHGRSRLEAGQMIEEMEKAGNSVRFVQLIQILHFLALGSGHQVLSVAGHIAQNRVKSISRVNKAWETIFSKFAGDISLENVASEIGMSPSAFSKFFRKHTNKTFIDVVQELRITHACRLITETDKTIAEIAYESGYNNLANFNRQFKVLTGKTPLEFKGSGR